MRRHDLFQMPTITSDGHLFESKLDEKMETSEESPTPTNTDPDRSTLVNVDGCAGVNPGGRSGVNPGRRSGVNPDGNPEENPGNEDAERAEIKMRYKCYIVPPILYPDGKMVYYRPHPKDGVDNVMAVIRLSTGGGGTKDRDTPPTLAPLPFCPTPLNRDLTRGYPIAPPPGTSRLSLALLRALRLLRVTLELALVSSYASLHCKI